MLIVLLLIARVRCEWVEITQQYYRKPIIPSHLYTLTTEFTGGKQIYANNSVTEHQWNKKPNNIPARLKLKPIDMNLENKGHPLGISEVNIDAVPKEVTGNVKPISHVEKVDNVLQLKNTLSKSSTLNLRPKLTRNEVNLFKKEFENLYHRTSYNNFKTGHKINMETTTEITYNYHNNIYETRNTNHISKHDFRNHSVSKHKTLIKDVESLEEVLNASRFHRIPEIKSQNSETIFVKTGASDISSEKPKVFSIDSLNIINTPDNVQLKTDKEIEYNKEQDNKNPECNKTSNTETENGLVSSKEKSLPNDQKSDAVNVIIKFVKLVSQTISSNTQRGFNSKVQYLEDLKNNLIANIEERIEATWPDNYDKSRRQIRATEDNTRGHIEFPSSESTLMSISFLTFAVFLIKLVLQVIQTYKNKTMMVAPLVVATAGRAALNQQQQKKHN